ncbi:MAG: Stp1/IreP family PP2C-type Ser/Thr phosphatase [Deltaproteobacteria bacterium]|nr:Stp1/IreP family PP2C-type Ser/Thr phosphatase [Deltaproteobacteria bacterium]
MGDSDNPNGEAANEVDKSIAVDVFGRTDVGLVRDHNEDNFIVADLSRGNRSLKPEVRDHIVGNRGTLFAVCDGMGGAAAGEVASQIAVDTIYEMMMEDKPTENDEELARRLDAAICEAGLRIFTAAKLDRKRRGMGTTVTAAVMIGPRLLFGQVGDSRAYILRDDRIVQVTKDQSLVQQLLDANQLTEEEARHFDKSNIILQALGTAEEVHVDVTSVVLRQGDVLIMCSDGLSGLVEGEDIRQVLLESDEPMEACRQLTDIACKAGGHDNITVIVGNFDGDGLTAPVEDEDLSYRKFRFAASIETTVRAAIPSDKEKEEQETKEETTGETSSAEASVSSSVSGTGRRIQTGLFAAATVALLIGVVLIAYTMSLSDTQSTEGGSIVPLSPESSTQSSGPTEPAEPTPAAIPTPNIKGEEAPALSPTPENALMSDKPADKPDLKAPTDDKAVAAEDMPSPPKKAKTDDSAEKVAAKTAFKDLSSKKSSQTKPSQKKSKSKKAKKKKISKSSNKAEADEKKSVKAKPIDDNPF